MLSWKKLIKIPSDDSLCSVELDFFSFFDLLDFELFTFTFGFFSFKGIDLRTVLPMSACIDSESNSISDETEKKYVGKHILTHVGYRHSHMPKIKL